MPTYSSLRPFFLSQHGTQGKKERDKIVSGVVSWTRIVYRDGAWWPLALSLLLQVTRVTRVSVVARARAKRTMIRRARRTKKSEESFPRSRPTSSGRGCSNISRWVLSSSYGMSTTMLPVFEMRQTCRHVVVLPRMNCHSSLSLANVSFSRVVTRGWLRTRTKKRSRTTRSFVAVKAAEEFRNRSSSRTHGYQTTRPLDSCACQPSSFQSRSKLSFEPHLYLLRLYHLYESYIDLVRTSLLLGAHTEKRKTPCLLLTRTR